MFTVMSTAISRLRAARCGGRGLRVLHEFVTDGIEGLMRHVARPTGAETAAELNNVPFWEFDNHRSAQRPALCPSPDRDKNGRDRCARKCLSLVGRTRSKTPERVAAYTTYLHMRKYNM